MDGPSDSLNTEQPSQRRHDVLSCVSEQQRASCSSVGLVHLAVSEHLPVRPHPTKRSDSGLGDGGEGGGDGAVDAAASGLATAASLVAAEASVAKV